MSKWLQNYIYELSYDATLCVFIIWNNGKIYCPMASVTFEEENGIWKEMGGRGWGNLPNKTGTFFSISSKWIFLWPFIW